MQFPCGELRHHPIAIPRPDAGHRFVIHRHIRAFKGSLRVLNQSQIMSSAQDARNCTYWRRRSWAAEFYFGCLAYRFRSSSCLP